MREWTTVTHFLVHITSSSPYTEFSLSFASHEALVTIAREKEADAKRIMVDLLKTCDKHPYIPRLSVDTFLSPSRLIC